MIDPDKLDALVEEIFRELRKGIRKASLDETLP